MIFVKAWYSFVPLVKQYQKESTYHHSSPKSIFLNWFYWWPCFSNPVFVFCDATQFWVHLPVISAMKCIIGRIYLLALITWCWYSYDDYHTLIIHLLSHSAHLEIQLNWILANLSLQDGPWSGMIIMPLTHPTSPNTLEII